MPTPPRLGTVSHSDISSVCFTTHSRVAFLRQYLFLYYGSGRQAAQLLANTHTVARLSQRNIQELTDVVRHGKQSEETIIKYCDWFLTTWNLKPLTGGDIPMRPESNCRIIRGDPSLQSSTRLTLTLLVISLRWDVDVRCYPQQNCGRRLTKIGVMYKYTLAESSPEVSRVWEHTGKQKVCLSAFADAGKLECGTREPKEREYKKNGRSAIHICPVKVPAKCPGKPTDQFKPITSNSNINSNQM